MPASSEKQRRFMGAELGRKRAGKATKTRMDEDQLEDFARKPVRGKKRSGMKGAHAADALMGRKKGY